MESVNIKELNDRIQRESSFVDILTMEMNKVIVGQKHLVENLLIGLLANGHIGENPCYQYFVFCCGCKVQQDTVYS